MNEIIFCITNERLLFWKLRKLRDYYAYEKEKLKWELERRKKEKLEIDLKDKEDCVVGCNEIEKERFGKIISC